MGAMEAAGTRNKGGSPGTSSCALPIPITCRQENQQQMNQGQPLESFSEQPTEVHDQLHLVHSASLHPRLAWMMCYEETGSAQAVAEKFGISRKTFYKWLKRYQESNGDSTSLVDRSRRPHNFPRATSESNVALLMEARKQTGYGQRRLRAYLEEKYNISLSERTIWKILKQQEMEAQEKQEQQQGPSPLL